MVKVAIIESEAGWGQRTDEIREFDTEKEADDFIKKFNGKNKPGPTPAYYEYAERVI